MSKPGTSGKNGKLGDKNWVVMYRLSPNNWTPVYYSRTMRGAEQWVRKSSAHWGHMRYRLKVEEIGD